MSRRPPWRERRRQRAALRRRLAAARQEGRARLERHPVVQRARQRRRTRRLLLLLSALLCLLALLQCECEPPPAPPAASPPPPPPVEPAPPPAKPARKPPRLSGQVPKRPRPPFEGELRPAPRWLDALRLQVAARSPRLAACVSGSERPGALRWNAAVNPELGSVSDQTLSPLAGGASLTGQQQECVLEVLSSPRYRLEASAGAVPERVSLLIEF